MARESQGLQIALIVFVMFTIIFGVMSFVFYRSYSEQVIKADDAAKKEQQKGQELAQARDENSSLKQMIGYSATEQEKTIRDAFNKTMEEQLQSIPAAERTLKKAVETLATSLKAKTDALAAEQTAHQTLKNALADRETAADKKFQQALAAQQAAQKDAGDERTKFGNDRTGLTTEREQLRQTVAATAQKADAIVAAAQADKDRANQDLKLVVDRLTRANDTIVRIESQVVDVPSGKIEWVNQRNKSVWINLGQNDYLNRLTTFSVFDAGIGNVAETKGKASIEVTKILGPHLAEARIAEDTITDPILPGDVIHTPIWEPGRQKHFALVGLIDIDGDGKSDLDVLINLIRMSGGVVDASQAPDGKVSGKMTPETNYLVEGKEPSESVSKDYFKAYSDLKRDANNWAIRRVGLQDLLVRMGYRSQERVAHFGSGAAPGQFRPVAPEGAQKKSTGNVAPVFQERQPPAKNGKSAF